MLPKQLSTNLPFNQQPAFVLEGRLDYFAFIDEYVACFSRAWAAWVTWRWVRTGSSTAQRERPPPPCHLCTHCRSITCRRSRRSRRRGNPNTRHGTNRCVANRDRQEGETSCLLLSLGTNWRILAGINRCVVTRDRRVGSLQGQSD